MYYTVLNYKDLESSKPGITASGEQDGRTKANQEI